MELNLKLQSLSGNKERKKKQNSNPDSLSQDPKKLSRDPKLVSKDPEKLFEKSQVPLLGGKACLYSFCNAGSSGGV